VEGLSRLGSIGLVPVVQLPSPASAVRLSNALAAAGLPCIEVTFRAAGAASAIAAVRAHCSHVLVGAGTVLTRDQAAEAIDAGAQFVVSPGTNFSVVDYVLGRGVPMLPGVVTPSEIEAALSRGLRIMKFFPAEPAGGAAFLTAVHGPYPTVRFVPTGGINAANLASYLTLPNVLACGGSWMASVSMLAAGDFEAIGRAASAAVAIVRHARPAVVEEPSPRPVEGM
jgi:2-dehydro-3-deoxyphosphogluconate aldolase/(4S)-4-hydroxy-2-oxoglutarate aldolase